MSDTAAAAPPLTAAAGNPVTVRADACPGCGGTWSADGQCCAQCGLARVDGIELIASGCAAYENARRAALAGRFDDALTLIADARNLGLPHQPAVVRLQELCVAASLGGGGLPESAEADYRSARDAAARGDWATAAGYAARAAGGAPWCLPARKLHLLCLAAVGKSDDAERQRGTLLAHVPAEPDLCRWRFSTASGEARTAEPVRSVRRALKKGCPSAGRSSVPMIGAAKSRRVPSTPGPRVAKRWPWPLWATTGLAVIGASCGVAALVTAAAVSRRTIRLPAGKMPVAAAPSVLPSPLPANDAVGTLLDAASRREYDEARASADEQQARRWLNAAVHALKAHDYARAERLAGAAYAVGKATYLADDALWVAAQAADRANSPDAAARYARIFEERAGSPYAAVARAQAARIAGGRRARP